MPASGKFVASARTLGHQVANGFLALTHNGFALLGLAVAGVFIWYASTEHHMALSRLLVLLCIPVLLVAPQVEPIPAEQWITKAALYLSGRDQPFTRQMWRKPALPLD